MYIYICIYIYIYVHLLQVEGGMATLRWHTPLSRPFNLGRLCKNQGKTSRNMQKLQKTHWRTQGNNGKWSGTGQKPRSKHRWSFPHKTGVYIYIYICTFIYIYMYIYVYLYMYIYLYKYVCIYIYIYKYVCMYT